MSTRKSSKSGRETKDRILDAALATVDTEGLVGASARAIARTGDFNQALVFYHFESVEGCLLAALERAHDRRIAKFGPMLDQVDELPQLVAIARELHASPDDPDHAALSAIVAGWSSTSDLGPKVLETLQPWNDLIEKAIRRVVAEHPLGQFLPAKEIAYLISAMFLGIEVMARLDQNETQTEAAFVALSGLANIAGPVLQSLDGARSEA